MRINGTEIRSSMDSRLSALDADPARRARIRQRIYEAEEPVMRRKLTLSAALAVALVLALVGTALAVGINLFEYFGNSYERFREIAPQTELRGDAVAEIHTDELGTTKIAFNSAYYDGQSLMVSYTTENDERIESFEPTAEQLAGMRKLESGMYWYRTADGGSWIPEGFEEAVAEGVPCGTVEYAVYPHDTFEANGIALSSSVGFDTIMPNGRYCLIEFENPLPEAVQNRDSLELRMKFAMSTMYRWYDGADFYQSSTQRDLGELSAVANRADTQTRIYAGAGSYNGVPVRLRAEVSAVHAALSIAAEGEVFQKFEDSDTWYDVCLEDERGERLIGRGFDIRPDAMEIKYDGVGKLPEQLNAYIMVCDEESECTDAEWVEAAEQIALTPQDE